MSEKFIYAQHNLTNLNTASAVDVFLELTTKYPISSLFVDEQSGKQKGVKFTYTSIDNDIIRHLKELELSFLHIALYRELRTMMTMSSYCFCLIKDKKFFEKLSLELDIDTEKIIDMYNDLILSAEIFEFTVDKHTYITCINAIHNFEFYFRRVEQDRLRKQKQREKERNNANMASIPSVPVAPPVAVSADPFNLLYNNQEIDS